MEEAKLCLVFGTETAGGIFNTNSFGENKTALLSFPQRFQRVSMCVTCVICICVYLLEEYVAGHGALTDQSRRQLKCQGEFWEAPAVFSPWGL